MATVYLVIFKKFKDTIKSDASGLLNLYEAAFLRVHREHKLEDALAFTTDNLKSMAPNLSSTHGKQVAHALEQCIHFGNPRIETRNFLSIYQEDEFKNEMLLRFAKLDCNSLQMLHKNELYEVSRRDINEINRLPEYIKPFYSALLNLYEQFDEELLKEGSFYAVHYAKEALKEHVRMWKSSGSSKDTCHLFSSHKQCLNHMHLRLPYNYILIGDQITHRGRI